MAAPVVTEQKRGVPSAFCHKSQTCEAGADAKRKVLFGCCTIWENGGLPVS